MKNTIIYILSALVVFALAAVFRFSLVISHQKRVIAVQERMLGNKGQLLEAQHRLMKIRVDLDSLGRNREYRFFKAYYVQDQLRWAEAYQEYASSRQKGSHPGMGGGQ